MSAPATPLPARRPELLIRPFDDGGQHVAKDPNSGAYYQLGEQEHFLLTQLDGERTAEAICRAYEERFGEPLGAADLDDFIELARGQGLLQGAEAAQARPEDDDPLRRHTILYWRKKLLDPDRLFTWLEPRLRFFWTRAFVIVSAGCMTLAALLVAANWSEAAASFRSAMRWETLFLAWLALAVVTTLHESAHGLTCKHYGGEVREVGFLLLFFMPCFYCNVSDAWLFKEKSKRLWVTLAGCWFQLFVCALAVFVWRLTLPGTLPHRFAFVTLALCGVQALANFNPFIKLDGYYVLSDWLDAPNLQRRGLARGKAQLRWLLWGAPRPGPEPQGKALTRYGVAAWLCGLAFLGVGLWGVWSVAGSRFGALGLAAVALLGAVGLRVLCHDLFAGEVRKMIFLRRKRTLVWLSILGGIAAVLCVPVSDWAGGSFQVRPAVRAELRAEVAGFVREVYCDEGDRVSPGAILVRLEVPELESRVAQKRAEVKEAEARLRLLEAGPRREEVAEQRCRADRAAGWRDLARQDLAKAGRALAEELVRLDKLIAQAEVEARAAREIHDRSRALLARRAIAEEQCRETERRQQVCEAQLEQARAERSARQARGALEAEAELARREKELADARAALKLLEVGPRPEEVEAERARLARLHAEARYLESLPARQLVLSPVPGVVTTARLKEKAGQYVREGEVICVIEEPSRLEVEVTVAEESVARVRPGQEIGLKARALPYDGLSARVDRIAPAAARAEGQGNVAVYGRLEGAPADLRPGMSGYARVYTGRRAIGAILADRALRFLRTEFWW